MPARLDVQGGSPSRGTQFPEPFSWQRAVLPLAAVAAIAALALSTGANIVGSPFPVRVLALLGLGLAPTVVILLPGLAALVLLDDKVESPVARLALVLVGSGVAGLLTFWAFFLSPVLGSVASVALLAASVGVLCKRRAWSVIVRVDVLVPVALMAFVALLFSGLAFDRGGLAQPALAVFDRFWVTGDHLVPQTFAERLVDGLPVRGFVQSDWHFSDRPPLQSAMLLPLYPFFGNRAVGYEFGAIALQSTWVLAAWALVRGLRVQAATAALVLVVVAPSGVLFFNSVYVWPKLLAGALLVAAFAVVIDRAIPSSRSFVGFVLAIALVLLGMLAHGSSLYPALALIPFFWLWRHTLLAAPIRGIAAVGLTVLALYAPWMAFQHFADPPGNRLPKWHLADVWQPKDTRSTLEAIVDSYSSKSVGEIAVNKLENFETLVWRPDFATTAATPAWTGTVFGDLRIQQIEILVPATVPLLLFAFVLMTRRARLRARRLAPVGLWVALTLIVWCLLQFGGPTVSRTVVHNGSLAPLVAILVACALLAELTSRRLLYVALGAQAITFGLVWVVDLYNHPANPTSTRLGAFEPAAALAAVAAVVALVATVVLTSRWQSTATTGADERLFGDDLAHSRDHVTARRASTGSTRGTAGVRPSA